MLLDKEEVIESSRLSRKSLSRIALQGNEKNKKTNEKEKNMKKLSFLWCIILPANPVFGGSGIVLRDWRDCQGFLLVPIY